MNNTEIKNLERELWDAADELRGNSKLTAGEYKDPLLGLVLLRFAQNRYEDAKIEVEKKLPINPRTNQRATPTKDDFTAAGAIMLPEKAKYDYLADLPESEVVAEAINNAMKLIEAEYPDLAGILPKSYQEFDSGLLRDLIRVFNKDAVKKAKGDVFGRIYEFFLMKFSMQGAGAQEGGEFFTPPSLVNLIVNFIQPNHGIIHDPACGSGGMFVQTAHFIEDHNKDKSINEAITVYGTELKSNNAKLAKMNLAIHGIEGKIIEDNSFYSDPHDLREKCDFVMANPPFNVDKVDAKNKFLTEDKRLPFGAPTTGKGTIGNGNYLFMQYFYSYLNPTGRAGFVMASSATDAGGAEKLIREKLIDTGDVECIVSVGNNFFYTRSLPCHLWFYNKGRTEEQKKKILMIDARNMYRVVSTTINDFSPGQQANLTAMLDMTRETPNAFENTDAFHKTNCETLVERIYTVYAKAAQELVDVVKEEKFEDITLDNDFEQPIVTRELVHDQYQMLAKPFTELEKQLEAHKKQLAQKEAEAKEQKLKPAEKKKLLDPHKNRINKLGKVIKIYVEITTEDLKELKQAADDWASLYEYFPEGTYRDIEGLCKWVDLDEVEEQDYSLTPGRYVGVSIDIDPNFDYKGRMTEIHEELDSLNKKANTLMNQIQSVKL